MYCNKLDCSIHFHFYLIFAGKARVYHSGAPDETRKTLREKIDTVCGNSKEKEHSRKIEEFTFTKARRSIEDWEAELKRSEVHPTKDNHFKSEYGVNYINTCKESWTRKEDNLKREWSLFGKKTTI